MVPQGWHQNLVIERSFKTDRLEWVAEAHRYVETRHKKGDVVITVGHNHKM